MKLIERLVNLHRSMRKPRRRGYARPLCFELYEKRLPLTGLGAPALDPVGVSIGADDSYEMSTHDKVRSDDSDIIRDASGVVYYVDPVHGDDANFGTSRDKALLTVAPLKLGRYCSIDAVPCQGAAQPRLDVNPGDVVVFMPGNHNTVIPWGEAGTVGKSVHIRFLHGTAENPIWIVGLPGSRLSAARDGKAIDQVEVLQSSYINIVGLDVTATGPGVAGILIAASSDIVVSQTRIHDVVGPSEGNTSGIQVLSSDRVLIEDSVIVDVYDPREGAAVARAAVLFGAGDVAFRRMLILNTSGADGPRAGAGITAKHDGPGLLVVEDSVFSGLFETTVGGGQDAHIRRNLLIDSHDIALRDFGGPTSWSDVVIEQNTVVVTETSLGGFEFAPSTSWEEIGTVAVKDNLFVDRGAYGGERGMYSIDPYGPDSVFEEVIVGGKLISEGNIYWNQFVPPEFGVFAADGKWGDRGGWYTLSEWQREFGFDVEGAVVDPQLDRAYRSRNPQVNHAEKGFYAGGTPRLTVLVDKFDLDESGANTVATGSVTRSGVSLDEPLLVTLSSTGPGQVSLPSDVLIKRGEASATFSIRSIADGKRDGDRIEMISATAPGIEQSISSWVRVKDDGLLDEPPQTPLVGFLVEVTDQQGEQVEHVEVGEEIVVSVFVEDLRPDPVGIFAAYADLNIEGIPTQFDRDVVIGESFPNAVSTGQNEDRSIHAAGGAGGLGANGGDKSLLLTTTLVLPETGALTIDATPTDALPLREVLLRGLDEGVELSQIRPGSVTIQVTSGWHNHLAPLDVDGDGMIAPNDALLVISQLNRPTLTDSTGKITARSGADSMYFDVNSDRYLTPRDALIVINELNRQSRLARVGSVSAVTIDDDTEQIEFGLACELRPEAVDMIFESASRRSGKLPL